MKYYSKPMFFFCLAIHVLAQNAYASAEENFESHSNETEKIKTVPLHFSHKKSPTIREMGYCQLGIYDSITEKRHLFPLLNIHTRSPNTSPRDKVTETPKEKRKCSRPLPKPSSQPQTYEHTYDIPCEFLEPGKYLCVSFFVNSIYLGRHAKEYSMVLWQGLKNITLFELVAFSRNQSGKTLTSIELSVDWNRGSSSFNLSDFDMDGAILNDLESATSLVIHYSPSKKVPI